MIFISIGVFLVLLYILTKTRIGMIIQAALSYPETVQNLGHNVPLIFMGVGAMTDFGPLIANPMTMLLGAAAQIGVFVALATGVSV